MKTKPGQSGLTLVEMTTVIAIVALFTAFAIPAMRTFFDSLGSAGSVKGMISGALASARAIAAKEQRYVGVRFQRDLEGHQYMVFVIQDSDIGAYFFRAVEGIQPVKLPDNIGVMDLIRVYRDYNPNNYQTYITGETLIRSDTMIANQSDLTDTTAFSIVFSPTGKMVIHEVRIRNRDGFVDSTSNSNVSYDDVFNKIQQVDQNHEGYDINANPPGAGMFYQDDYFDPDLNFYPDLGLGPEPSRRRFVIYDKIEFAKVDPNRRWTDYLRTLDVIYINPYTGTIVSAD